MLELMNIIVVDGNKVYFIELFEIFLDMSLSWYCYKVRYISINKYDVI